MITEMILAMTLIYPVYIRVKVADDNHRLWRNYEFLEPLILNKISGSIAKDD